MSATPAFAATPRAGLVQIANADASNQKDVLSAGANGTKVTALMAASDDTSARVVQVSILRSATNYVLGSVSVAAASGTDGATAAVDLLKALLLPGLPVDADGQHYLFLESGDKLQVKSLATVTSAKLVHVTAVAADL
jgi:hypothetical protein